MEAIYKRVYELFDANKQLFIDAGFQPIRTIDKYRGQTINPQKFEIFETPALFIRTRTKWNKEGKQYTGNITVDFHLVIDEEGETANLYSNYEEALKQAFYYRTVQVMLDDLSGEGFSKLTRVEDVPVDLDVFAYDILTYSTQTTEKTGGSNYILVDDIEVEIRNKQLVRKITTEE